MTYRVVSLSSNDSNGNLERFERRFGAVSELQVPMNPVSQLLTPQFLSPLAEEILLIKEMETARSAHVRWSKFCYMNALPRQIHPRF